MTYKLQVSVVVDGPDSAGWYDVRVNGVDPFDSESREDAEEYAARLRAALRECGETEQQTEIEPKWCTAHHGFRYEGSAGARCQFAANAAFVDDCEPGPCVLVPLFLRPQEPQ